ncbi:flocculation protein FLO11-like [Stegodyphus dumicola]|uniref:flocculation protein FLO11-like n=1 Tax=Stegodyphus dumicola TaxID=202533 RepID=UPI0015AEBDF1|nr:flocculation protein FLO11-like [Stegodyphus dumicola]
MSDPASAHQIILPERPPRLPSPTTPGLPPMPSVLGGLPQSAGCPDGSLDTTPRRPLSHLPASGHSSVMTTRSGSLHPAPAPRRHISAAAVPSGPPLLRSGSLCQMLSIISARTSASSRICNDVFASRSRTSPPSETLTAPLVPLTSAPSLPSPGSIPATSAPSSDSPVCHHTRSRAAAGHSCSHTSPTKSPVAADTLVARSATSTSPSGSPTVRSPSSAISADETPSASSSPVPAPATSGDRASLLFSDESASRRGSPSRPDSGISPPAAVPASPGVSTCSSPVDCPTCGKSFLNKRQLRFHRFRRHRLAPPPASPGAADFSSTGHPQLPSTSLQASPPPSNAPSSGAPIPSTTCREGYHAPSRLSSFATPGLPTRFLSMPVSAPRLPSSPLVPLSAGSVQFVRSRVLPGKGYSTTPNSTGVLRGTLLLTTTHNIHLPAPVPQRQRRRQPHPPPGASSSPADVSSRSPATSAPAPPVTSVDAPSSPAPVPSPCSSDSSPAVSASHSLPPSPPDVSRTTPDAPRPGLLHPSSAAHPAPVSTSASPAASSSRAVVPPDCLVSASPPSSSSPADDTQSSAVFPTSEFPDVDLHEVVPVVAAEDPARIPPADEIPVTEPPLLNFWDSLHSFSSGTTDDDAWDSFEACLLNVTESASEIVKLPPPSPPVPGSPRPVNTSNPRVIQRFIPEKSSQSHPSPFL